MPVKVYEAVMELLGCLWSVSLAGPASWTAPISDSESELQVQPMPAESLCMYLVTKC
jgi:hypothetical protein